MSTWHRFQETPDGDDQCIRCATVVAAEALTTFTMPCPAGDCTSPSNPDRGCVFVPGRGEVCCCIFCGRPGGRAGEVPPPDLEGFTGDEPGVEDFDPTT